MWEPELRGSHLGSTGDEHTNEYQDQDMIVLVSNIVPDEEGNATYYADYSDMIARGDFRIINRVTRRCRPINLDDTSIGDE